MLEKANIARRDYDRLDPSIVDDDDDEKQHRRDGVDTIGRRRIKENCS